MVVICFILQLDRQRQAREYGRAIHQHCAGAAMAQFATVLGTGKV